MRTLIVRNGKPEPVIVTPEKNTAGLTRYRATAEDKGTATGDTPEEAADNLAGV